MRTRLTYLALRPDSPRRVAQWIAEGVFLLLAVAVIIGLAQLPALAVIALGGAA